MYLKADISGNQFAITGNDLRSTRYFSSLLSIVKAQGTKNLLVVLVPLRQLSRINVEKEGRFKGAVYYRSLS